MVIQLLFFLQFKHFGHFFAPNLASFSLSWAQNRLVVVWIVFDHWDILFKVILNFHGHPTAVFLQFMHFGHFFAPNLATFSLSWTQNRLVVVWIEFGHWDILFRVILSCHRHLTAVFLQFVHFGLFFLH